MENKMEEPVKLTKKEILAQIDEMIKSIENLPAHAKLLPMTQYDFCSLLMMIHIILTCKEE